eukprot:scaffold37841_cov18-Prasinocladus_malaysianus.AAC.1
MPALQRDDCRHRHRPGVRPGEVSRIISDSARGIINKLQITRSSGGASYRNVPSPLDTGAKSKHIRALLRYCRVLLSA